MPGSTRAPDELRAAGSLVARAFAEAVRGVQHAHTAIAGRAFGTAPTARRVESVHHAVTTGVYAGVLGMGRAAVTLASGAAAVRARSSDIAWVDTPRGSRIVGALDGAFGDLLAAESSPLALPMTIRLAGRDVAATPSDLRAAFPAAAGRIVVFLHGLCEDERAWTPEGGYGTRLAAECAMSDVYLRYNSGLHISENGALFAQLLDALVEAWPVQVTEVALVGHSMGGLIARSACHLAEVERRPWAGLVRHLVYLGSPHRGAPLEKAAHAAAAALAAVPETQPLGRWLRARSAGVKDLRFGNLVEADWAGHDADRQFRSRRTPVVTPTGATHHLVGATLTRDPRHPVGWALGDVMVRAVSAHGDGHGLAVAPEHRHHLGGAHHFTLLHNQQVADLLVSWLSPGA